VWSLSSGKHIENFKAEISARFCAVWISTIACQASTISSSPQSVEGGLDEINQSITKSCSVTPPAGWAVQCELSRPPNRHFVTTSPVCNLCVLLHLVLQAFWGLQGFPRFRCHQATAHNPTPRSPTTLLRPPLHSSNHSKGQRRARPSYAPRRGVDQHGSVGVSSCGVVLSAFIVGPCCYY
jgi:hypothetical protein